MENNHKNDAIFRKISSLYVEQEGEKLLQELAVLESQPDLGVDQIRIKKRTKKAKKAQHFHIPLGKVALVVIIPIVVGFLTVFLTTGGRMSDFIEEVWSAMWQWIQNLFNI